MDKEQQKQQRAAEKEMWQQLEAIVTSYKPGDAMILVKISDMGDYTNTRVMANAAVKYIVPMHRAFQEIIEAHIEGVAEEFGPLEAAKLIAQIMADRSEDKENADE